MHIPSSDIYPELMFEPAGIWFVPSRGTDTHAILLKASSNGLKALITGASLNIGFSLKDTQLGKILLSAVYIEDDKTAPLIIVSPHIQDFQQTALIDILRLRTCTPIFFFDELGRNIAEAECEFDDKYKNDVINLIGNPDQLYAGKANEDVIAAIDSFIKVADGVKENEPFALQQIIVTKLVLTQFEVFDLHSVAGREVQSFSIADADEGGGLEQSIWHLLKGLFMDKLYRSPRVDKGGKMRELTDILAISDYGIFLIESKVTAMLNVSEKQTSLRRAKNIETHIRKALKQLVGAIRALRQNRQITTSEGQEIAFDRKILPHAIVLISEMHHMADWKTITREMFAASLQTKTIFHIIDLRELVTLVTRSPTVNHFDDHLMKRAEKVTNAGNAFLRANIIQAQEQSS